MTDAMQCRKCGWEHSPVFRCFEELKTAAPLATSPHRASDDYEAADRLAAMKAAGDVVTEYAGHKPDCRIMTHGIWSDPIPCDCGLTEAIQKWKDASHD